MKDPTFWILARASGLTAYVLITLSMLAGLVVKSRPFGRAVKAASVVDVHRFLTILALGAVAIHAAALVLDSTVHIGPAALLVPGPRDLPAALDRSRGRCGRACLPDLDLVPAPQADRHARLAEAALGDLRRLRCSPPPTA